MWMEQKSRLSGRRVFETINTGMEQTSDMPAETTKKAFGEMTLGLSANHKTNTTADQEKAKISILKYKSVNAQNPRAFDKLITSIVVIDVWLKNYLLR